LVEHLRELAEEPHPVGILGYGYALERAALFVRQEHIDATQAVCPPGVDATRGMRVHSSVGSDAAHVLEMVRFVATLPGADRAAIARAVYRTARILSQESRDGPLADGDILGLLHRAGVAWPPKPREKSYRKPSALPGIVSQPWSIPCTKNN
jgi:hypothetical protein